MSEPTPPQAMNLVDLSDGARALLYFIIDISRAKYMPMFTPEEWRASVLDLMHQGILQINFECADGKFWVGPVGQASELIAPAGSC